MSANMYDNFEAERARNGWTIKETADRLGIDERTYRDRMYMNKDLRSSELLKYAEVFGCSVDYLLGLSDKITIA